MSRAFSRLCSKVSQVFPGDMENCTQICDVCLNPDPDLVRTADTDDDNVRWSVKLSYCVPEIVSTLVLLYMIEISAPKGQRALKKLSWLSCRPTTSLKCSLVVCLAHTVYRCCIHRGMFINLLPKRYIYCFNYK